MSLVIIALSGCWLKKEKMKKARDLLLEFLEAFSEPARAAALFAQEGVFEISIICKP